VTVAVHLPQSEEGKRFSQFFDHRYNFIEAPFKSDERPEWQTNSAYPIEHRNLWNRFLDPVSLIGVSFGSLSHYAVIDIDRGSPYHPYTNEAALKELLGAYEEIGFNDHLIVQSSASEGIHLYFPLPKEVPTHKLAVMMKLTAIRAGFEVKDGTLEIFPNAKPYNPDKATAYKAHRLPLQAGSYLLDENYLPYSDSIKTFLDQADQAAAAQDIDLIETAIATAHETKAFRPIKGDGSRAAVFAQDLKEQIEEGWTDYGQTNDLLRIIGTYGRVFESLEGKALADYIVTTAKGLPGYWEYCQHQHQIERRAQEWARCIEKFYYPYGTEPNRVGTFGEMVNKGNKAEKEPKENKINKERQQSAVERIIQGVEFIKEKLAEIPEKVGEMKELLVKVIIDLFGVRPSDQTLNRNKELWHPSLIVEREVEIIILGGQAEEQPEQQPEPNLIEALSPAPAPLPRPLEPEALQGEDSGLCHTPPREDPKNSPQEKTPEALPAVESSVYATPPLYMKVRAWEAEGAKLIYEGRSVAGMVEAEGEKKAKIQSLFSNQEVIITNINHSTYFFHPEDEERLQVYVILNSVLKS